MLNKMTRPVECGSDSIHNIQDLNVPRWVSTCQKIGAICRMKLLQLGLNIRCHGWNVRPKFILVFGLCFAFGVCFVSGLKKYFPNFLLKSCFPKLQAWDTEIDFPWFMKYPAASRAICKIFCYRASAALVWLLVSMRSGADLCVPHTQRATKHLKPLSSHVPSSDISSCTRNAWLTYFRECRERKIVLSIPGSQHVGPVWLEKEKKTKLLSLNELLLALCTVHIKQVTGLLFDLWHIFYFFRFEKKKTPEISWFSWLFCVDASNAQAKKTNKRLK